MTQTQFFNLQFYMQHELQKFELTLDRLSCEEAMKNFQFPLNKCVEKFVPTKNCKGSENKKLWVDNEIKHLAAKKRQQYQNFMRTKDKNDQLKFNALRNKRVWHLKLGRHSFWHIHTIQF